jgi:mannitol/fructose-specific phosphotransferase system IIA component (Ntr-type)
VRDFAALKKAVELRDAPVVCENGSGLLIAHGRTESVSRLVLAAGRCESPFLVSGSEGAVRLVFVAGIPTAFSSEYLRVVGAIVRVCRNPDDLAALLSAATTAEFVERLTQAELKL